MNRLIYSVLLCGLFGTLDAQSNTVHVSFLVEPGVKQAMVRIDDHDALSLPANLELARGVHTFTFLVDSLETNLVATIESNQQYWVNQEMTAIVRLGRGRSAIAKKMVSEYQLNYGDTNKMIDFSDGQDFKSIRLPFQKDQKLLLQATGFEDQAVGIAPYGHYIIRPEFKENPQFSINEKASIRKKARTRIGIGAATTLLCAYWFLDGLDNRSDEMYQSYQEATNPKLIREAYLEYTDEVNRVNAGQFQSATLGVIGLSTVIWSVIQLRVDLEEVDTINKEISSSAISGDGKSNVEVKAELTWHF